jgi:carbonic anhydrase
MKNMANGSKEFSKNMSFEQVMAKLLEGNERFFHGKLEAKDISHTKRSSLLGGQSPFAIVLSCSDSRVLPELIFDQSLGDLFVIRVAGNVVGALELASIEYAAVHLKTKMLIILVHTHCGAVTAAVDTEHDHEGNIREVIKKLRPAVEKAKGMGGTREDIIQIAIKENAFLTENEILKNSEIIRNLVEKGQFKIVKALYNMATGRVEILSSEQGN